MKVGIGITTYNRKDSLRETLNGIYATCSPGVVVVSDDGSTDGTHELQSEFPDVVWLFNKNGGIARNKNRLIFRLFAIERCDAVILMEDDVVPISENWFYEWFKATVKYGHVNIRFNWMEGLLSGKGGHEWPYISTELTGQIMGISSKAWRECGYMDPRFTSYGYEHIEYSRRLAKNKIGGCYGNEEYRFICLSEDNFKIDHTLKSSGTSEKIREAFEVLKLTTEDTGYKDGWTNQAEFVLECLDKD